MLSKTRAGKLQSDRNASAENQTADAISLDKKEIKLKSEYRPALTKFFNEIANIPVLTLEQEFELASQRIAADKAIDKAQKALEGTKLSAKKICTLERTIAEETQKRDEIICKFMQHNIKLAVKIAADYNFLPTPIESRIDSANEGVREAARRFDPEKGGKFSTYAVWWIRQKIFRDCSNEGHTIRIPIHLRQKFSKLNKIEKLLTSALGRTPTDNEVAEELGITLKQMGALRRYQALSTISLDAPINDSPESGSVGETIADSKAVIPGMRVLSNDQLELLDAALQTLEPKHREILLDRFGIGREKSLTLEEIGKKYSVTRERIRQIQVAAFKILKKRFNKMDKETIQRLAS